MECFTIVRLVGRLQISVKSFCVNSRICVRVENSVCKWFPVRVNYVRDV